MFTVKIRSAADDMEGVEAISWKRGVEKSGTIFVDIEQLGEPDRSGRQEATPRRIRLGVSHNGESPPTMVIIENRMGETTQVIKTGRGLHGRNNRPG